MIIKIKKEELKHEVSFLSSNKISETEKYFTYKIHARDLMYILANLYDFNVKKIKIEMDCEDDIDIDYYRD